MHGDLNYLLEWMYISSLLKTFLLVSLEINKVVNVVVIMKSEMDCD